ncbi:Protein phosphatase PP2A regulatory subunit B [Chytriomyces hyalinus]|nr:Protein phosphatase PP2A regulatory subunit B [Chytriomyces hyalinus]
MADPLDAFPTLFISGLPPNITELDIVNVMSSNNLEAKVVIDKDPITLAPRVKAVFRYVPDAERFFATVNGSAFLGSKVHLTFKDPNMNFSNTSGSKTIVVKRISLQVTSLELYDAVRTFGRIIFCKVMMDRSGMEAYALLQFEEQLAGEKCVAEMNGFIMRGSPLSFNWQFPKNSNHIYPSMRPQSLQPAHGGHTSNSSPMPILHSQMPSGLEGGINVAVSAGWNEQPMTPGEDSYSPQKRQSWMRNNSYDSTHHHHGSMQRPASPMFSTPPPKTVQIRPTTGWHSRTTVNPSLILEDAAVDLDSVEHSWDEAVTITLDDLKAISPAHAVLASQVESSYTSDSGSLVSPRSNSGSYPGGGGGVGMNSLVGLDCRNLYVKNLPIDPIFTTDDLYALFSPFGRIVSAKVMMDESIWVSKGFGFVSFSTEEDAFAAIDGLNGYVLDMNLPKGLVVCVAEPRGFRERKLMVLHGGPAAAQR